MALNKNSNLYTIIYTVVMVVIVGALLAILATGLESKQEENVRKEQKTSIMKAFGDENGDFNKVAVYVLKNGNEPQKVEGKEMSKVFDLLSNRKKLAAANDELPIFEYEKKGVKMYVVPLVGKGLWGEIWGYIALEPVAGNLKIVGITMDHAGETPGLGAEIATPKVQKSFNGKMIYDEAGEFAVRMQKGGAQNEHQVDAITGGTKTCDGVNDMLKNSIMKYEAFFNL